MRKVAATVVSATAAAAILGVALWMVAGNGGGDHGSDAGVQIILPADAAGTVDAAGGVGEDTAGGGVTPSPAKITVYVTGEVVDPGVYEVDEGRRLSHAIEAAGGATESADLERINLAAYLSDAAHYRVPATGETEGFVGNPAVAGGGSTGGSIGAVSDVPAASDACAAPVNINTATAECLETLPGIGSVRADAIVAHREQAGPFASADGITEVSGIGDGTYSRIGDLITVGRPVTPAARGLLIRGRPTRD